MDPACGLQSMEAWEQSWYGEPNNSERAYSKEQGREVKKQELSSVTAIRRLPRWKKYAERQDKERVPGNNTFRC